MKHIITLIIGLSFIGSAHARFSNNVTTDTLWQYTVAIASGADYAKFYNNDPDLVVAEYQAMIDEANIIFNRDLGIQLKLADPTALKTLVGVSVPNNITLANLLSNAGLIQNTDYDIKVRITGPKGGESYRSICEDNPYSGLIVGANTSNGALAKRDRFATFVHEIGHHLGAAHTFTAGGASGGANNLIEPGSGTTIMSYMGATGANTLGSTTRINIVDESVDIFSDMHFHASSIDTITQWRENGIINPRSFFSIYGRAPKVSAKSCGQSIPNPITNAADPVVNAGADYTIPASTHFELTGQAVDDGNTLTYDWEQMDADSYLSNIQQQSDFLNDAVLNIFGQEASTLSAIYRVFNPIASPTRSFPLLGTVLNNEVDKSDRNTTIKRDMAFRLGVRDGQNGYGDDNVVIHTVVTSTPFKVTSQATCESIDPNTTADMTVTWDVGETDLAPISCPAVDISLMVLNDDESSYSEEILMLGADNNGSAVVALPNINSRQNRVKIKCSNNVFYSINPVSFQLTGDRLVSPKTDVQYNTLGAKVSGLIVKDETYPTCRSGGVVVNNGAGFFVNTGNGGTTGVNSTTTPITDFAASDSSGGGGSMTPMTLLILGGLSFIGLRRKAG